ncbi:hypothetical protein [Pseudorhodoferax sp.]|uniref:hypothetical protein n=1 Tax=Pseudorhodoferax sp. TaxID=1993553 RepID=UPI002DD69C39|nr:hypothetical protein [Pseudorhodoferax sp.]
MRDFDEHVWKLVTELAQQERHFNGVQHHYRLLASTWLLAMFGGTGFALSTQALGVPPALVVAVLGLAGAIGITQLWNLDIRVYHQLLDSCFVQGLKLEREHPWLPQLRSSMLATQADAPAERATPQPVAPSTKGVLARVVWFYVVGNTTALLVALAGTVVFLHQAQVLQSGAMLLLAIAVGIVLMVLWASEMFKHTRSPLLEQWSRPTLPPTVPPRRATHPHDTPPAP